jgi:hypothetical protein
MHSYLSPLFYIIYKSIKLVCLFCCCA